MEQTEINKLASEITLSEGGKQFVAIVTNDPSLEYYCASGLAENNVYEFSEFCEAIIQDLWGELYEGRTINKDGLDMLKSVGNPDLIDWYNVAIVLAADESISELAEEIKAENKEAEQHAA